VKSIDTILSVGIDIGTTTTQLVFSRITLENMASFASVPRIVIVDKEVIYRSKIHFTPLLSDNEIDYDSILSIVNAEYKEARIVKGDLSTGAVIITGETSRKNNADKVLRMLSGYAGDFVVATAGPHLEAVLAAKGAGVHTLSKKLKITAANFDIGGGTTEIAVIALGGIVCNQSIRTAGDGFTSDIQQYMRHQHQIKIGERTAENIKITVGSALSELEEPPVSYTVHGPQLMTALPAEVTVGYQEVAHCLDKSLIKIENAIQTVLEQTPPELYADIVRRGIFLTGGGALLRGLDKRLKSKLFIPFHVAEDPLHAVARGTGIALKSIGKFPFLIR